MENLKESSDFDWVDEQQFFIPIDYLLNRKMYWRNNNLASLQERGYTLDEITRDMMILGTVRYTSPFILTKIDKESNEGDITIKSTRGKQKDSIVEYDISDIENYVRIGIWVVEGDDDKFLNL
jgi:hypothetical protein